MQQTTLVFLRRDGELLLAMKKRRFGVGKWNGAGGKVEAGETIEEAAIRECQEEINVTPRNLQKVGILDFHDLPDVEHACSVFITTEWDGTPEESEEMRPQWFQEADIPYNDMWADDTFWIPLMLAGKCFTGKVVIENDRIIENTIHEVDTL